jgi:lipooligosaccharide transport system permease protein
MTFDLPTPRTLAPMLTRFWWEYRQLWKALIMRDLLDRLIYLVAFGFGMGAIIETMHGIPYLQFLVPGIAASTGIFVMTMAMTYGVWERSTSYKLYSAWLATPVRLPDILFAELVYAALRTMPSIIILFVLAGLMGGIGSYTGTLISIPILLLANICFGAMALCFTVHIHRPLHFAYVNTLWTTPMFLFSGVFFDLNSAPWPLWVFSQLLPLTHIIDLVRPLVAGLPLDLGQAALDFGALIVIAITAYIYSLRVMKKRLEA